MITDPVKIEKIVMNVVSPNPQSSLSSTEVGRPSFRASLLARFVADTVSVLLEILCNNQFQTDVSMFSSGNENVKR